MINEYDLQRFNFRLNEAKPVHVILNSHKDFNDHYFDMHYEFELGVVINGRMKRQYIDCQMEIGPGDAWFCGMWEPHGFELLETPCEAVVFVTDPEYIAKNKLLNHNILLPFQAPPKLRPRVIAKNRAQLIDSARKTKMIFQKSNNPDWAKLQFFQILLVLMESWKIPKLKNDFRVRKNITNALKLVFNEKRLVSTQEAASACMMSVSKFRYIFKILMHSSFSEFALKYRVRGAIDQLKNSNETQEAVALHWGFTDASHLHKYIKKFD